MRARLLEATVDCLVERGFARYVDHAGLRAGRGQPGRPAAPLPDQERPGRRRRRAPHRGARARSSRAAAAGAADRAAAHPRGPRDARATTSPRRCSPPRSSSGSRPAPTPTLLRGRGAARAAGRPRDAPARPSSCSAPTSRGRASASWCRPPSTWSAASAWPTRSPTTPAAARGSSTSGPTLLDDDADARGEAADERTCSTAVLADLDAEGDRLDGARRRPRRGRLAHAHPGRRLGRRHPGRAPGLDRRGRALAAATDKAAWDALVLAAHRRPRRRSSTRGRPRRRRRPAGGPAGPLAAGADGAGRGAARRCPDGREDAVVRPADVGHLDGDRPVHGDLGARPATSHEALGVDAAEPTDRIRHVAHLGVRTRDFAFSVHGLSRAGRASSGSS